MAKVLHKIDSSHSLFQFTDGFSFGTDAVLLSGFIRCRKGQVGVELGTGTGIIPLLLSIHKEFEKIYALEIQHDYALLAEENIAYNGFSNKVEVIWGDLKNAKEHLPFFCDFVFANPPYMGKDTGRENENEKKRIARHEVFCTIREVCQAASDLLQDGGNFYCVYRTQRLPELFQAMQDVHLAPKDLVLVTPTPQSEPSLVLVRGVKGAKPGLMTRAPFLLQDLSGKRTPEALLLYEKGVLLYGDEWKQRDRK